MACSTNYINVYGHCDGGTPSSGLYINKHLAGINLKKAANIAEGELQTGVQLLEQAIEVGISKGRSALVSEMLGTVRFNSIISSGQYGKFPLDFTDTTKYLAATSANRGLKFQLDNGCRLSTIYVRRVQILTNTTIANGTLTITDGGEVTTYTFNAQPKEITFVETNYKAQSTTVHITLNNTAISVADSSINTTSSCGFCSNDCMNSSGCDCSAGLSIWGWDGTNTTGSSYGLSALVDVICDEEKFFCEISHIPDVAWLCLYHAGIWAFEYALLSGRVNVYTNYGKEALQAQIEQWRALADQLKVKLVKQLPKYLLSIDGCCIECSSSRWETSIP